MRIFLLTGEPSGDMHGAHLARAIRARAPQADICGVGGTRMRQAGVSLVADSEHWGAIGIAEALRKVPALLGHMHRLLRYLRTHPPDVLVLIDFGAFNVRLLRKLQASGMRIVYYIPPGSWSRHRAPGQLPFLVDAIATPFPWSADNLRRAGAPATITWVGHPLAGYTRNAASRDDARKQLGIDAAQPVVALVPGSRTAEIRYLLEVFFAAMGHISPTPLCLLSVAPSIGEAAIRRLAPADLEIRYLDGLDYTAMRAADAALTASGTATLELACLDIPMVVAYRGSFASWLQYQVVLRLNPQALTHIALPNILADQRVVPEYLQEAANPAALASALTPLLHDTPERQAQLRTFADIRGWLGDGDAAQRTAAMILEVAATPLRRVAPTPPAPAG